MTPNSALDFAGIAALLAVLGAGIKYLFTMIFTRSDRRIADLEKREAELAKSRDGRVADLEKTVALLDQRLGALGELVSNQRMAIHLLVTKIAQDEPDAMVLRQVDKLLGNEFPAWLRTLPPDMIEAAGRIKDGEQ